MSTSLPLPLTLTRSYAEKESHSCPPRHVITSAGTHCTVNVSLLYYCMGCFPSLSHFIVKSSPQCLVMQCYEKTKGVACISMAASAAPRARRVRDRLSRRSVRKSHARKVRPRPRPCDSGTSSRRTHSLHQKSSSPQLNVVSYTSEREVWALHQLPSSSAPPLARTLLPLLFLVSCVKVRPSSL